MTFISYSQNFEDVILNRVFKNKKNGFYIDVGAGHPIEGSVTYSFYKLGWVGINIEPSPNFYKKLIEKRKNDYNLNIAVNDYDGSVEMYMSNTTGLSTIKSDIAQFHEKSGYCFDKIKVECLKLDTILSKKISPKITFSEIHFLKIDVEGNEFNVIKSISLKKYKPWIIVVESTVPSTQIDNSYLWEDYLLEYNYSYAYFDGLNKFYVHNEHKELSKIINCPPNIYDDYISCKNLEKIKVIDNLNSQLAQKELLNKELNKKINKLNISVNDSKLLIENLANETQILKNNLENIKKNNNTLKKDIKKYSSSIRLLKKTLLYSNDLNNKELEVIQQTIDEKNNEIHKIYSTFSWKITYPLRIIKKTVKLFFNKFKFLFISKKLLFRILNTRKIQKNSEVEITHSAYKIYRSLNNENFS